ncbi:MAG: hypothetical protein AAB621_02900 [Patescibacteria group bacterium]
MKKIIISLAVVAMSFGMAANAQTQGDQSLKINPRTYKVGEGVNSVEVSAVQAQEKTQTVSGTAAEALKTQVKEANNGLKTETKNTIKTEQEKAVEVKKEVKSKIEAEKEALRAKSSEAVKETKDKIEAEREAIKAKAETIKEELKAKREQEQERIKAEKEALKEGVKAEREQKKEAVKSARDESKQKAEQEKEAVKASREEFKQKAEQAREEMKASREEFKNKIEVQREELKTKREEQKVELKTKLEKIKDERKKATVEKLDKRFNEINVKMTAQWSDALLRLEDLLVKISLRADKAAANGADVSAVGPALEKAKIAIVAARTAISAQASKAYPIDIVSETELKSAVAQTREKLNQDLKAVREVMQLAHQATVDALTSLKGVPKVDEAASSAASTSAAPASESETSGN